MRERKRIFGTYTAWNYDREVADLNLRSEKGWQLVHGGSFSSIFRRDTSCVYRYALDYNTKIEDDLRYREIFREQGWEYVNSTFNGWHYFRKRYDPQLPESEYVIYTDSASLKEMKKRWLNVAIVFSCLLPLSFLSIVMRTLTHPDISRILMSLTFLFMEFWFIRGAYLIKRADQAGNAKKPRGGGLFMLSILIPLILSAVFSIGKSRIDTHSIYSAAELGGGWSLEAEVKLPDFYSFELTADVPEGASVVLRAEDGTELLSAKGDKIDEEKRLFLMPGTYTIYTDFDENAPPEAKGEFHYRMD